MLENVEKLLMEEPFVTSHKLSPKQSIGPGLLDW